MKKVMRSVLWGLFLVYCLVLIYLLFVSRPSMVHYSIPAFFREYSNFVPFRTIAEYVQRYQNGFRTVSFINLVGNLFAFFPMGIFLPCLFKPLRRFGRFFLAISGMVMLVEITQVFLRVGVIDIDDVIFNVLGGIVGYGIVMIPFVRRSLEKLHLQS